MFIAHLPAGYLLHRCFPARIPCLAILIGAVAPDLDLALVLSGCFQGHHHTLVPHRPAIWVASLVTALVLRWPFLVGLAGGWLLHVFLDSVAGHIDWCWPVYSCAGSLVIVPPRFDWWVFSFLLHWSFAIEALICAVALRVFLKNEKTPKARTSGVE